MDLVAEGRIAHANAIRVLRNAACDGGTIILSAALGLAWGQTSAGWVVLTPCVVLLWWWARRRSVAFVAGLAYHAIAARSLMVGMAAFFEVPVALGIVAVACCAAVHGAVWAVCWKRSDRCESWLERGLRLALLLGSSCLPVVGAFGLASPLAAAGLLFTGLGWLGLALLVASLLIAASSRKASLAMGITCALRCGLWNSWPVTPPLATGFEPVHTSVRVARDMFDFERQWDIAHAVMVGLRTSHAPWRVAPESVGGLWQPSMQRVWSRLDGELRSAGRVAIVGATLPRTDGDFDNGAVVLGGKPATYRQRMPIPLAMWRPWAESAGNGVFHAHWFGPGVVHVNGRVLGVLICFESALVWPIVGSVAQGAEVLVALTNGQWLEGTGAVNAQRQTLESWGALFGLPVVLATNE